MNLNLKQLQQDRATFNHYGPGALNASLVATLFDIAEAALTTPAPAVAEVAVGVIGEPVQEPAAAPARKQRNKG